MLKQWTWLAVWTLRVNIFSHTKSFYTRTSKNQWINCTGSGVEIIRSSHAQEISSLAPTRVQSYVPGDGGTGNKLVAGFPFWPSKQSLATLFYKVKASVLLSAIRFPSLLHVIQYQKVHSLPPSGIKRCTLSNSDNTYVWLWKIKRSSLQNWKLHFEKINIQQSKKPVKDNTKR